MDPILPQELERVIFTAAARANRRNSVDIGLVAQRVWEWVRPIRYEVLSPAFASRHLKLQDVGKYVRYLMVSYPKRVEEHLLYCNAVEHLACWVRTTSPKLFSMLTILPLRRLSIALASPREGPFDFRNHPLPYLTHLEILDEKTSWSQVHDVSLLPNLTHLAYNNPLGWVDVENTLRHCEKLRVFIIFLAEVERIVEKLPAAEGRVVFLNPGDISDWVGNWNLGVDGGRDLWARAEETIALRNCHAARVLDERVDVRRTN